MSVDTYHIPPRTRQMIVDKYMAAIDTPNIKHALSETYNVSIPSINGYIKRYTETGTVLSAYELSKKYGQKKERERQKIFDNDDYKSCTLHSRELDPTQPLKKYVEGLCDNLGIYIEMKTINRLFEKENVTWERIARVAIESEEEEEALFWQCHSALVSDPKQVVFLDESHRNDKSANPTYGRGKGFVSVFMLQFKYKYKCKYK